MSTVYADTLEPTVPTKNTTLGASGDSITIGANSINTNVIQDSGGNVLFQSDGSGTLSNVNSAFSADLKLLSTQTASNSATVSFTSGIDSTYDVYVFKFIDIAPATDGTDFRITFSSDGGSSYGMTKTTTYFEAQHSEAGSGSLSYRTSEDLAQSTSAQILFRGIGSDSDEASAGELYLFAPSDTTFVKHFYATLQGYMSGTPTSDNAYVGGYVNSTSAVNAIQFAMASGNFDGIIKLYGISKT